MSLEELRVLLAANTGKAVSLYNDHTRSTIRGTIDELWGDHCLWIRCGDGRRVVGLPQRPGKPQRIGRELVFQFTTRSSIGVVNYRLTVSL